MTTGLRSFLSSCLVPARSACGGRGGWGSLLRVVCGAAPFNAEAPTPASRAGYTSVASYRGKGEGKGGGGRGWCLPIMLFAPPPLPLCWGGGWRAVPGMPSARAISRKKCLSLGARTISKGTSVLLTREIHVRCEGGGPIRGMRAATLCDRPLSLNRTLTVP